jgi:hypothetical protein
MSRLLFAKGARGDLVKKIQRGLHFQAGDVDGVYGNQTTEGVVAFQRGRGVPGTGEVDTDTWSAVTREDMPALFERVVGLTAAIEGHGFTLAQGNFDGAGITWGIIGFTLEHGELARIVLDLEASTPRVVQRAFEEDTDRLLAVLRAPLAEQMAFADEVSIPPKKVRLAEPWRSRFDWFGTFPEVQAEQLRRARESYWEPALATARQFGLQTELGLALAFDVHVQNGGVKAAAARVIRDAVPLGSELELRRLVANAVADQSSARWRDDVRQRKLAIAEGHGVVHGERLVLRNWGLDELPAETA